MSNWHSIYISDNYILFSFILKYAEAVTFIPIDSSYFIWYVYAIWESKNDERKY